MVFYSNGKVKLMPDFLLKHIEEIREKQTYFGLVEQG